MVKKRIDPSEKISDTLQNKKRKLIEAVVESRKKNRRQRMKELSRRKIKELEIKQMSPDYKLKYEKSVGRPGKIIPEMERILFQYYTSGASLRAIHRRFGKEMGFSYNALINARDFYQWEDRCNAIRNLVMNDNTLQIAERYKDYLQYLDDLISESMIRFSEISSSGKINSPFETLKITNMKDLKDVISVFIELSHGGIRRHEIKQQIEKNINISDDKAAKILEVLSGENSDDEEYNDEII